MFQYIINFHDYLQIHAVNNEILIISKMTETTH